MVDVVYSLTRRMAEVEARGHFNGTDYIMERLRGIAKKLGPKYKASRPFSMDGRPVLLRATRMPFVKRREIVIYRGSYPYMWDIETTEELEPHAEKLGKDLERLYETRVRVVVE